MAHHNPTWGEERIADELKIKLGIRVSPRTVSKYLARKRPGGEGTDHRWATFIRNHATAIVACDFFISVTLTFRILYVFVAMEIGSPRILHCNDTAHRTADCYLLQSRTHSALGPGTPESIQAHLPASGHRHHLPVGYQVTSRPVLGGLHHDYRLEQEVA
jgi:putative transposase